MFEYLNNEREVCWFDIFDRDRESTSRAEDEILGLRRGNRVRSLIYDPKIWGQNTDFANIRTR